MILSGAILGSTFYMIYFPLIVYTYNEILLKTLVTPSLISTYYFELIDTVFFLTIIPGIVMGVTGVIFSKKIISKILTKTASLP